MSEKFCVNCKYFGRLPSIFSNDVCWHKQAELEIDESPNLVTGLAVKRSSSDYETCVYMRGKKGKCGKEALLFEQRELDTEKPKRKWWKF